MAWESYALTQSPGALPPWLLRNSYGSATDQGDGRWLIERHLFRKRKLEPGESWETTEDGSKLLVRIDPVTGEKGILISYAAPEDDRVPIYRIRVDLNTGDTMVEMAVDASTLDRAQFELYYPDMA